VAIRILIADDHGVLRAGLRALLKTTPEMRVVGEAADGQETLRMADRLRPDVVLLDISMPEPGGIEVTRQLKETLPKVRVLILTAHEDEALLRAAIEAGASGYIIKRAIESELISALYAVQRGEVYVHPAMAGVSPLKKDVAPSPISSAAPAQALNPQEIEVLCLIARGHTNRQTAQIMDVSRQAVEKHRSNLMSKLGLRGRVGLVRYAREHGLLDRGER